MKHLFFAIAMLSLHINYYCVLMIKSLYCTSNGDTTWIAKKKSVWLLQYCITMKGMVLSTIDIEEYVSCVSYTFFNEYVASQTKVLIYLHSVYLSINRFYWCGWRFLDFHPDLHQGLPPSIDKLFLHPLPGHSPSPIWQA